MLMGEWRHAQYVTHEIYVGFMYRFLMKQYVITIVHPLFRSHLYRKHRAAVEISDEVSISTPGHCNNVKDLLSYCTCIDMLLLVAT